MRIGPDDELFRVRLVWLGPRGLTLPWTARYLAYGIGLVIFGLVMVVEAVFIPGFSALRMIWELMLTAVVTSAVMLLVDHERPVKAVWQTFWADLRAPRPARSATTHPTTTIRVIEQRGDKLYTTRSTL